ncbi:hypothetical protein PVAG01_09817 [Phlyctema vagabunda]|uniref:Uncharacterized protein n=1 Tax=Phlyctema vagabunda TaxID=108571 RepID=A0ABR4P4I5_9HELO
MSLEDQSSLANTTSTPKFSGPKVSTCNNIRKALRIEVCGEEHLACPDSGSERNIMSARFASENKLRIRQRREDFKRFELGNGKHVYSIGRVRVSTTVPGLSRFRQKKVFYVLAQCPAPLVAGMPFLEEYEILSRHKHLLVDCPSTMSCAPSLLWIGSPRKRLKCTIDGRQLVAAADTGSDLNFISSECAKREGFHIDRRREARRRIRVGDGNHTETIGQVYIYNISLDWRTPETTALQPTTSMDSESSIPAPEDGLQENTVFVQAVFHVLPGLPCDVILGRHFLLISDAFNLCSSIWKRQTALYKEETLEFNVMIDLGPVQILWNKIRGRKRDSRATNKSLQARHDEHFHAEMYRRSKARDAMLSLPFDERDAAQVEEDLRKEGYKARNATCSYCR